MARYMRGYGQYKLGDPIVGPGIAWHGPGTYLTYPYSPNTQNRRRAVYALHPPQVVTQGQIFFGPKVNLSVMLPEKSRRTVTSRAPEYFLRPPVVVSPILARPTLEHLAYSRRGQAKSTLRPPTDTIGLEDQGQLSTTLAPQRRGRAKSTLRPPAVVTAAATDVFYGPQVSLTNARRARPLNGLGRTPAVQVYALGGVMVSLAPQRRGQVKSALRNFIVPVAVVQIYYGPAVHLTRIRPRRGQWALRPPTILQTNLRTRVTLAYSRRGRPVYRLRPPTDTIGPEDQGQVATWLTYSRRGRPVYDLRPPTDTVGIEDQGQVSTTLAYSRRGRPVYRLQPPAILQTNGEVRVTLAPQRRGAPKSGLRAPVVVFLAVEIYGPEVHLTRIKPPPTLSFLRPPTDVVDQQDLGAVKVHLAYSRRGRPVYALRPFSARAFEVSYGPQVTLTLSRRPITKSALRPPAVVAPVVSYGPLQWLTYSRRGTSKPFLNPPAVVASPPAYTQVLPPWLTYSRRGQPKSSLKPPTRVFPFIARPTVVSLAPQARGIPKSRLSPPAVLKTNGVIQITLAYQRRGRPLYVLHAPTVVRLAVEIYGPKVWLTYSRRPVVKSQIFPGLTGKPPFRGILVSLAPSRFPRPVYELRAPAVVARAPFRGIKTWLTYSRRGRPIAFRHPEVAGTPPFRGILTHLTRIKPPPVLSVLKPPGAVGAGIAFYGPLVVLVRIRPPKVTHALRQTLVSFRRPSGDVCGFDIAGSFVCSLEVPGSQVSGTVSTRFGISGSSRAGSSISGSESPGGSVSGSDRKAT